MQIRRPDTAATDLDGLIRRREERQVLRGDIALHLETGETIPAVMTEISTRGCRLEVGRPLRGALYVTVTRRATMIGGRVA